MQGPGGSMFGDEERSEVMEVLESGHLSRYGEMSDPHFKAKVLQLEQEFASMCGTKYALATTSGTSALLLGLLALGIGEGDEVLVPGFTYVATLSAIVYTRAVPVLVEIDETLSMDPLDAARKITSRTRAILAVHMLGSPCDMAALAKLADEHGLLLLEDACQATGGSFGGRKLGTFGTVGAFSLNRYKILSAGEGGLLVTSELEVHRRAFALHDQGHTPIAPNKKVAGDDALFGLNLKMNELTGAVALAQVRKLDRILTAIRARNRTLRRLIGETSAARFRPCPDADGDCGTVLVVTFSDARQAAQVAKGLDSCTLANTGWHVYSQMAQLNGHRTATPYWSEPSQFAAPGSLPRTDDLLSRSIGIGVGVADRGLGTAFGVSMHADDLELESVAAKFRERCGT